MLLYYYRLNPPRPTFAQDMTAAEKSIIGTHAAFWGDHIAKKQALLFGPVFARDAVFGLAIVRADSPEQAHIMVRGDPALIAGIGFSYELCAMDANLGVPF